MSAPIEYTRTNQVRLAAQQLRNALKAPESLRASEIRAAREWLTSAAEQHENDAARARQGFLAESAAAEPVATAQDVMSVVISDLYVGNTLMAAGNVLEETGAKADPALLDQALIGIQQGADLGEETARAFAFVAEPVSSPDLQSAREAFRKRAAEVLDDLVRQAQNTCSNVVDALKKIDAKRALEALEQIGGPLAELPKLGVLLRKGMEKVQNALDFLRRMLDSAGLTEVKEKISAVWGKITDGTWADALLGWTFNRSAIESLLPKVVNSEKFRIDQVDMATGELAPLTEKFGSEMKWARAVTAAVGLGGGLIVLAGVTGGMAAVYVGGAYLLVLAAIIVIGRDCAGSGALFHGHHGVRSIVEEMIEP